MGGAAHTSTIEGAPGRAVRGFWIFSGRERVMQIENRPGHLISVAAPGPGGLVSHPWLHGVSRGYEHEHKLRQILLASSGFDDFVNRLVTLGYDLVDDEAEVSDIDAAGTRFRYAGRLAGVFWGVAGPPATLWWQPAEATPSHTLVTCYDAASAPLVLAALASTSDTLAFIDALGPEFSSD